MLKSEARVQQDIRLAAPLWAVDLWRNNVGAVTTDDGRHIRFGLCNDSAAVNKNIKSSDLIGVTQVTITPEMVGQTVGVFTSIEVKKEGWAYSGTDREEAQKKWHDLVRSLGGLAGFASSVSEFMEIVKCRQDGT